METKEKLGEWRHIVLFAKYHYGDRKNEIKKLKEIHSFISGVKPEHISTDIVINKLIDIMDKLNVNFERFLRELMSRKIYPLEDLRIENLKDEIKYMLNTICNTKVGDIGYVSEELKQRLNKI